MRLYFLGTGSQKPTKTRNVTSIALILDNGHYILFDCGEATQHQIIKSDLSFSKLNSIFITHLHGDHIFGLPGLLCSLNDVFEGKDLNIYGPLGLKSFLSATLLNGVHGMLQYKLNIIEFKSTLESKLDSNIEINTTNNQTYFIQNFPVKHTVNEQGNTYGFVIKKKDQIIKFKDPIKSGLFELLEKNSNYVMDWVEKNTKKNIKNIKSILSILQNTNYDLVIEDIKLGKVNIRNDPRFIECPNIGNCICLIVDTCCSNRAIEALNGLKCDVLVHEATNAKTSLDNDKTFIQIENETIKHGHSTPQMAGRFAKLLGASKLILTHFSSRYKGDDNEESIKIMDEIKNLAINEFDNTNVIVAKDFMDFKI